MYMYIYSRRRPLLRVTFSFVPASSLKKPPIGAQLLTSSMALLHRLDDLSRAPPSKLDTFLLNSFSLHPASNNNFPSRERISNFSQCGKRCIASAAGDSLCEKWLTRISPQGHRRPFHRTWARAPRRCRGNVKETSMSPIPRSSTQSIGAACARIRPPHSHARDQKRT